MNAQSIKSFGRRAKQCLLGALALAAVGATSADAQASSTVHLSGRYYICDITMLNTSTNITVYSDYGCQGSYVGYYQLVGPGRTAKNVFSATRFESTSKWLSDNRWSSIFFAYDDSDNSLFYVGSRN